MHLFEMQLLFPNLLETVSEKYLIRLPKVDKVKWLFSLKYFSLLEMLVQVCLCCFLKKKTVCPTFDIYIETGWSWKPTWKKKDIRFPP